MTQMIGASDNDQPAVGGFNNVTPDRLVEIAIEQSKTILEIGSGAGVIGKGVVGVEATGVEKASWQKAR